MSQAVKAAMLATKDLGKNERAVVIAIAAHANQQGNAWPSVATIAEYAGCSERTVQRCVAKLVQLGRLVVSKVAGIATRVYRLVTGQSDNQRPGATESGPGGDSASVSPEVLEDHSKVKNGAAAPSWRRWLPKTKQTPNPQQQTYGYPERRGAALPPDRRTDRCSRHIGERADNCRCCRAESLGGVV